MPATATIEHPTAHKGRAVARIYETADGRRAVLLYADRHGAHRVTHRGPEGEAATWAHPTVEAARERWAILARELTGSGFRCMGAA